MAWILLEGLDRSGKSSVAKHYEEQGYKVVHMEAPDKKYFDPSYGGESYLEEIVRMYSEYDGQDVIFDRSCYGELIWPNVYGRLPMLTEEDLEYLGHMERNNDASKILMYDSDTEAHWQRCVENKEPLTRQQFGRANIFYERLANDYGFQKKQLTDFEEIVPDATGSNDERTVDEPLPTVGELHESNGNTDNNGTSNGTSSVGERGLLRSNEESDDNASIEDKLEKANAIRALLSGKIIKKKGEIYDQLDEAVREFLQRELDEIFSPKQKPEVSFSDEEIAILKIYAQRIKEKL